MLQMAECDQLQSAARLLVFVLQVGEIGNHESLLEQCGIYSQLLARQLAKQSNMIEQGEDPGKKQIDNIDKLFDATAAATPVSNSNPSTAGGNGSQPIKHKLVLYIFTSATLFLYHLFILNYP